MQFLEGQARVVDSSLTELQQQRCGLQAFCMTDSCWSAGRVDVGGSVTARDIMIATGSVPFVPPGIPIDGKTVRFWVNRPCKRL